MALENRKKAIPDSYTGTPYYEVMASISQKRSTKRYLEIGVKNGHLLKHIHTDLAIGVDPFFDISENFMENKIKVRLHQVTSDSFFANKDIVSEFSGTVELAFLDGMHTFEFLLRDFYNTEKICASSSLIAMHDCMPLNAEMTHREMNHSLKVGESSSHPYYWTGDVWKIIPILKKYRPDLRVVCVGAPPTGIVFVTNLDPNNTVLKDNYINIVQEFSSIPSDLIEIEKMYNSIDIIESAAIIKDFDHSLYFSI